MKRLRWVFALAALLGAVPGEASDGVIEINQACATQGGCGSADTGGFPVTIFSGGSYRLTSDLEFPGTSNQVILIQFTNGPVTVDLGGFTIRCVSACSPSNTFGIVAFAPDVTVRNGSLTAIPSTAMQLAARARVEDLRVHGCGGGVGVGEGSLVRGVTVSNNGYAGVECGDGTLVIDSVFRNNSIRGITAYGACGYARNVVTGNGNGSLLVQIDGGTNLGGNLCAQGALCP